MPLQLIAASTAAGKSAWLIDRVRAGADAGQSPLIVVATTCQAQHLRQRLVAAGGVLGVHVFTFDELYAAPLDLVGSARTELHPVARQRLLRVVVDELRRCSIYWRSSVPTPPLASRC